MEHFPKYLIALVFIINLLFCDSSLVPIKSENNFATYIHNLIDDFNTKHPYTNDIVVIKIGNQNYNDLFDDLMKEIPMINLVIQPDPNQILNDRAIRPAPVIIIFWDFTIYDMVISVVLFLLYAINLK